MENKSGSIAVDIAVLVVAIAASFYIAPRLGVEAWWVGVIVLGIVYLVLHVAYSLLARALRWPRPTPLGILDLVLVFFPW